MKAIKNEITVNQLRHKYEIPMIIIGIISIIISLFIGVYFLINGGNISKWISGILMGLLTPALAFFLIRYKYWESVSNGVEITERQFPEVYEIFIKLTKEMGFSEKGHLKRPRLYLNNGNGVMNAFAAKCTLKKRYIVIYSDLLDVAYKNNEFGFLRFILAHELGHHKCGHTNIWRLILTPALKIMFLDKSLTRAQEYTADRVALYYAGESAMELIYLFSGKYMGAKVDLEEYFHSIEMHDKSIWLKLNNFLSDHPVGFRRMQALKKAKENGWNIHGKML